MHTYNFPAPPLPFVTHDLWPLRPPRSRRSMTFRKKRSWGCGSRTSLVAPSAPTSRKRWRVELFSASKSRCSTLCNRNESRSHSRTILVPLKTLPSAPLSWLPFSLEPPPLPPDAQRWCVWVWKVNILVPFRLINHLAPGSVKKIHNSTLNWHQVSFGASAVGWSIWTVSVCYLWGRGLGFFFSTPGDLFGGKRPTFSGSLKVFGYKISCNYYRFFYSW